MKVLGIVGSKRKNGNTATLVKEALEKAENEGLETEIIYLGSMNIKGCTGCEQCKDTYRCIINDDMQGLYGKIMSADAMIVGSPTYFYNISSDLKALIERLYCFEVFDEEDRAVWMSVNEAMGGKLAVTIAISEQHNPEDMGVTSQVMDASFASLGYRIVDSVKILKLYEKSAAIKDETALLQAGAAGRKLARTLILKERIMARLQQTD